MHTDSNLYATDIGPACPDCDQTLWLVTVNPGGQSNARCCSCAVDVTFIAPGESLAKTSTEFWSGQPSRSVWPTIDEVKAALAKATRRASVDKALSAADEAFWRSVAQSFPHIKTGRWKPG